MSLKVNQRFAAEHRDLSPEEFSALEENIKANGILDPIIVWQDFIVDGHHRYKIAKKLKIDPPIRIRTFADEDAALEWLVNFQLARRNLSPHDFKLKLGKSRNLAKARLSKIEQPRTPSRQFDETEETQGKVDKTLAAAHGVSVSKVERSGKYAAAYDQLPKAVKTLIDEKPSRATEACVLAMSKMTADELNPIARDVRVGNVARFDDVVKPKKAKPKASNGNGKPPKRKKATREVTTAATKPVDDSITITNDTHPRVGLGYFWQEADEPVREDFADVVDEWRKPPKRGKFQPPSLAQVRAYCQERKNNVDPEAWMAHYESNGWKVGKNAMKDWQAAVRTWEKSSGKGKTMKLTREKATL